ncbi:MAG: hypothetical protein ACFB9M_11545 [Myxococcota bacterium]
MGGREAALQEAAEEAERRRKRFVAAADALKDRIESDVNQVQEAGRTVDRFVRNQRWPLLAAVAGFGFALGFRGRRAQKIPVTFGPEERAVVVVREPPARASSSLAAIVFGMVVKRAGRAVAEAVGQWAKDQVVRELEKSPGSAPDSERLDHGSAQELGARSSR